MTFRFIKDDQAVSPVVGVMLMLVVTIIIAAVVSAFAGGMSDGTKKVPQSAVTVTPDITGHQVSFEHNGGDAFSLDEIEVVFQTQDQKVALSPRDVGTSCIAFNKTGGGGSMIKAGERFVVVGRDPGWARGITLGPSSGSTTLQENNRISWIIIDKQSAKTIASGNFVL